MENNKKKRVKLVVLISIIIILLFLLCFGLYKSKANNKLARITDFKTTALSANIMEKSNEIKSYDTITYNLSYKVSGVSGKRDIIITGTLNKDDIKYASWVIPEEDNMSASFSDNNRVIKILVKNIDANTNYNTKIKLNVTRAPDGYNFDPTFKISDSKNESEDISSNISNQVVTKTISGKLDGDNVESVELNLLKLSKDGEFKTYKTTVTDKDGKYTFNDIESGDYKISINNNNIISENNDVIKINNESKKFDIKVINNNNANVKIDKYIKKIIVNQNGKETTYDYNNLNKAILTLKSVNNLNAKIIYGFRIYNSSNKEAIAKVVKEEIPSGLSYNKDDIENKDWINQDGVLYNRTLSGTTLKDNESKYLQLSFRIVNKNQAEEYINTVKLSADVYHKVIFTDGKNIIDEKVILDADKVEEEPSPLKTGYSFVGWYKDDKFKEKFNFDTYISKDTVIYAKFNKNIKYYSIKFIDQGKDYFETKVEEDKLIDLPKNPTKDGYTFTGWSEDASCEDNYDFSEGTSKDLTLYSCYKEKPIIKYDVTFKNSDTDEEYPEYKQEVDEGGVVEEPSENPKVTCKSFDHWSLEKNGEAFNFSTPINKDTVLYAVFNTNELKLTYMHDGEVWEEKTISCGKKPDLPSNNPTKEGEEFDDWKDDDDNPLDPDEPVDTDKTYHSTFNEMEKPTISHSPTTYIKDKVVVTISTKDGYKTIYKENDNEYKEYTKPFEVYDNETIYAHYKKIKTDEESLDAEHLIDNFDKEAPIFTSTTIDENKITDTSFTIDNKIIDNLSGMNKLNIYLNDKIVKEYDYSSLSDEEKNKEISESILIDGLASETTYNLKLEGIDRVGNISETNEIQVSTLTEYVCRVISVNGHSLSEDEYMYYRTLNEGLHDTSSPCSKQNYSCTIQMLRSVKESNIINNGQKITLDLNGKSITSLDDKEAFTNYDTLTIINSVKSSDDNTTSNAKRRNAPKINNNDIKIINNNIATITSPNRAIYNYNPNSPLTIKDEVNIVSTRQEAIYNSGILQIGEDDFRVSNDYPVIKGVNYGVKNEGYTVLHPDVTRYDSANLKFYDGVVYGQVALKTKKIETPISYKTTTKRVDVGQKSYLAIIDGAEAEINGIYYKKIEDAFKEAQPGDTIKVLKDIMTHKPIIKEIDGDLTLDLHGNRVTATRLTNDDGTESDTYLTLKAKNFTIKNGTFEDNDKSNKILNLNLSGDLNITDKALISGDSILNIKGKYNTSSSLRVIAGTASQININGNYGTSGAKDSFSGTVNGDVIINSDRFNFFGSADKIITKDTSLFASGNIPYIESNGNDDSVSSITSTNDNPTIKLNGGNQTYNGKGTITVTNATLSGNINTPSDKLIIDEKSTIGDLTITTDKLEVNNVAKKITANVSQSPIVINKDVDELVLTSDIKDLTITGKGKIKKIVIPNDYNVTLNNIKVDEIENNGVLTAKNLTVKILTNKNIANVDSSSIEKLHNEKNMNVTLLNGKSDIFNSGVLSITGNEKDIDLDDAPIRTFTNSGTLTLDDIKFKTMIDTNLHPETYLNYNSGTLNLYNVEIKPTNSHQAKWLIYNQTNGIINFGKDETKKPKLYFYSKEDIDSDEINWAIFLENESFVLLNSGSIQNLLDSKSKYYNEYFFSDYDNFKYRDLGNNLTTYFMIADGKFNILEQTKEAEEKPTYLFAIDDKKYYKLQDAINDVPDEKETTIKVLKDFTITQNATISENKNIILDLNRKNAKFINNDGKPSITNNGNLKIINDENNIKEETEFVPQDYNYHNNYYIKNQKIEFDRYYQENDYKKVHKNSGKVEENLRVNDTTCDAEDVKDYLEINLLHSLTKTNSKYKNDKNYYDEHCEDGTNNCKDKIDNSPILDYFDTDVYVKTCVIKYSDYRDIGFSYDFYPKNNKDDNDKNIIKFTISPLVGHYYKYPLGFTMNNNMFTDYLNYFEPTIREATISQELEKNRTFKDEKIGDYIVNGTTNFDKENLKFIVNLNFKFEKESYSGTIYDIYPFSFDINYEIPLVSQNFKNTINNGILDGTILNTDNSNFSITSGSVKNINSTSKNDINVTKYAKVDNINNEGTGNINFKGQSKYFKTTVSNINNKSTGNIILNNVNLNGKINNEGTGNIEMDSVTGDFTPNLKDYKCSNAVEDDYILYCENLHRLKLINNNSGNITIKNSSFNINNINDKQKEKLENQYNKQDDKKTEGSDFSTKFDFISSNDAEKIDLNNNNYYFDYSFDNSNFITTPSNKTTINIDNNNIYSDYYTKLIIDATNCNGKITNSNLESLSVSASDLNLDNSKLYNIKVNNLTGSSNLNIAIVNNELNLKSGSYDSIYYDTIEELIINNNKNSLIKGGLIHSLTLNNSNLTISGGYISDLTNNANSSLTILNKSTIKNIINDGILTLGNNDGNIEDKPLILGSNYGILGNGVLNYYDGTIKARKAISQGSINLPTKYGIDHHIYTKDDEKDDDLKENYGYEIATLKPLDKIELIELITDNGTKKYNSENETDSTVFANVFKDIISTDENNYEIKILSNLNLNDVNIEIPEGKNIKLNLNNGILIANYTTDNNILFINNGNLNIIDGEIDIYNTNTSSNNIINNNNILNLTNTKFVDNKYLFNNIINNKELTITCNEKKYEYYILNNNEATKLKLNNTNSTIKNYSNIEANNGSITIDNNTDSNDNVKINNSNVSISGINGGNLIFNDKAFGIIHNLENNGVINSNSDIYYSENIINNNTINEINGGSNLVYTNNTDIKTIIYSGNNITINNNKGELEVKNTSIDSLNTLNNTKTTLNNISISDINNSGELNILKSKIKSNILINNNIVNFKDTNLNINSLENNGTINYNNNNFYASNISGNGNINIGTKDGKYNSEEPLFSINNISNDIKLNLYDGIIKRDTSVAGIKINDKEEGDYTEYRNSNIIKLLFVGIDKNGVNPFILKSNNGKYKSISDAINDSKAKDEIELSDDYIKYATENDATQIKSDFTVPEGKEITLDLKYFTFFSTITNNGTLIFSTNAEEKRTYSDHPENEYYKDAIVPTITNNGNLIVNNGTYYHMRVINNSNYTIKDGAFRSQYITNNADSNLTIDNGDFSSFVLENKEGANAIVNNGLFVNEGYIQSVAIVSFINSRNLTINNMTYIMDGFCDAEFFNFDLIKHPGFRFYQYNCGIYKLNDNNEYERDDDLSNTDKCIFSNYPEYNDDNINNHTSKYLKNIGPDSCGSNNNIVADSWDNIYNYPSERAYESMSSKNFVKTLQNKTYTTLFDNRDNGILTINNGQFGDFNSNETRQDFSLFARDNSITNLNGGNYFFEQYWFGNGIHLTQHSIVNINGGDFYDAGSEGCSTGIINIAENDLTEKVKINFNGGNFYTGMIGYERFIRNQKCLDKNYQYYHREDECIQSNYLFDYNDSSSAYSSIINTYSSNEGNADINVNNINVYNYQGFYNSDLHTSNVIENSKINFNFNGGNFYILPAKDALDRVKGFLSFGSNSLRGYGGYKADYTVNINDINYNGVIPLIYSNYSAPEIKYEYKNGNYNLVEDSRPREWMLKININGGNINSYSPLLVASQDLGTYNKNGSLSLSWPMYTVNIGKKDGKASDGPVINVSKLISPDYGTYSKHDTVNYYDGTIITQDTAFNYSDKKFIREIEPGYIDVTKSTTDSYPVKMYHDDGTITNVEMNRGEYTKLYKMKVADEAYVFSVNDNHFTNLQEAINYVQDSGEITMSSDYIMPEDITIPNGKTINIVTNNYKLDKNNHTIINNGVFTIDGADASNLLGNILRTNTSKGTNIVLTTLNNGNNLEFNGNYKLYKYIDNEYKVINTKEVSDNSGRYIINDDNKDSYMNTINGRLYLNNIDSGKYKVLDKDNNEITFNLDDKGKLQGNAKINYSNKDNSLVASSTASVLVQIRTGKTIINYALILVLIIITIIGLIIVNRKKEN